MSSATTWPATWTHLLLLSLSSTTGSGVRVFSLQDDAWAAPRQDVYIKYDLWRLHDQPFVSDTFTVCYRALHTQMSRLVVHTSYAENNDIMNGLFLYFRGEELGCYFLDSKQRSLSAFKTPLVTRTWQHYCHVFASGQYALYIDGDLKFEEQLSSQRLELSFNGTLVLGQEQDVVAGGFVTTETFLGRLAQYNIWDQRLSHQQIQGMAGCSSQDHGNVLSSDLHDGDFINVSTEDVDVETFCQKSHEFVIIPANLRFPDAASFCRRTGSVLYTPDSAESNSELHRRGQTFRDTCIYSLWLGVTDEAEEGEWRSLSTNKTIQTFFERGLFNTPSENCVSMGQLSGLWYMWSCNGTATRCLPCEVRPSSFMLLRGLCFSAGHMRSFEILDSKNGTPFLHGLYGYNMYLSDDLNWYLFDSKENKDLAFLPVTSKNVYPIGIHEWQLTRPVCEYLAGSSVVLGLSTCGDDQFMCSNGDCVSRLSRCDTHDDCVDHSDEEDCGTIIVPDNYRRHKSPKNNTKGQPLLLVAQIELLRFLQIEDTQNAVNIEFTITLDWQDFRITFTNLHEKQSRITTNKMEMLWRPALDFPNAMSGRAKLLGESMKVRRTGEALPPDINQVKMDWVYPSSSGILELQRHYIGRFVCIFSMFYYPFDIQRCLLEIREAAGTVKFVVFDEVIVVYHGEKDLASYSVSNFKTYITEDFTSEANYSAIKVEFLLARQPVTIFISVFIPTMMLVVIGYSTLHLSLSLTQVRMVVSLTTLLVLYTLFNQTSSSLPKTAYVKMVDVWFFLCICTLFVIILFHVFVGKLSDSVPRNVVRVGGSKPAFKMSAERAMQVMRTRVVPLSLLVYVVVFWSIMAAGSTTQ